MFRYSQRWLIIGGRMNGIEVVSPEFQDFDILLDSEVTIARDVGESVFKLYSSKYKTYYHPPTDLKKLPHAPLAANFHLTPETITLRTRFFIICEP